MEDRRKINGRNMELERLGDEFEEMEGIEEK